MKRAEVVENPATYDLRVPVDDGSIVLLRGLDLLSAEKLAARLNRGLEGIGEVVELVHSALINLDNVLNKLPVKAPILEVVRHQLVAAVKMMGRDVE